MLQFPTPLLKRRMPHGLGRIQRWQVILAISNNIEGGGGDMERMGEKGREVEETG